MEDILGKRGDGNCKISLEGGDYRVWKTFWGKEVVGTERYFFEKTEGGDYRVWKTFWVTFWGKEV